MNHSILGKVAKISPKQRKERQIRNRNTKILERLPIPEVFLPEWVQRRRRFIEYGHKLHRLMKEKNQTLSN